MCTQSLTENGSEEPVAFASKNSQRELNYPVHEKQGAALIFDIKKLVKYLTGRTFVTVSDNIHLVEICGEKNHQHPLSTAKLFNGGKCCQYINTALFTSVVSKLVN